MTSSEDQELSIINVPHDVIRRVIRLGQEDIDVMRQISPQWNTLACEHFNNRKHLPVINYLCWATNDDGQTKFTIRVSKRLQNYFNLNNWQLKSSMTSVDCEPILVVIGVDSGDIFSSSIPSTRTINRIFGRCSRIENLAINMDIINRRYEMGVIKNAITGVSIGKLEFKRDFNLTNSEHTIMDLIGVTKVERIAFIKRTLTPTDVIISVVSRFLRCVSAIELASCDIDDVEDARIPRNILRLVQQAMEVNQLMQAQQAAQLQAMPQIQNLQNNNQQGQLAQQLRRSFQQMQEYVTDALEWRNFNGILNRDEKLKGNFYEETFPNGIAKFRIDISIKET